MKKQIKPFSAVKVGDMAYESPDAGGEWNKKEGPIVWKGNLFEFIVLYPSLAEEWMNNDDSHHTREFDLHEKFRHWAEENHEGYSELVVVNLPLYGNTAYAYNVDPSSIVCFETPQDNYLGDVPYWDGYLQDDDNWEIESIFQLLDEITSSTSVWLEDIEEDEDLDEDEVVDKVTYYAIVHHYLGGRFNHHVIGAMVSQL